MHQAQGTVLLPLALWLMSTELPPRPDVGGMSPWGVRHSVQYHLADQGLYIAWDSVGSCFSWPATPIRNRRLTVQSREINTRPDES